jgi:hypothetical protein
MYFVQILYSINQKQKCQISKKAELCLSAESLVRVFWGCGRALLPALSMSNCMSLNSEFGFYMEAPGFQDPHDP